MNDPVFGKLVQQVFDHGLPVCFVGGPYTKPDPSVNVNAAARLVDRLWQDGIVFPICPMVESHIQHLLIPRDYEPWLLRTMRFIPLCNVGIFRSGESSGKDREQALFRAKEIPFFESPAEGDAIEHLYSWVGANWRTRR